MPDLFDMEENIFGGGVPLDNRPDLEEIVRRYNNQAEEQVFLAHKRWAANLREYIRTETGLQMGVNEKDFASVPMTVTPGIPKSLSNLFTQNDSFLDLLFVLPQLETTVRGLEALIQSSEMISFEGLAGDSTVTSDELRRVLQYTENVVNSLKKRNLLNRIANIDEDILGAYFYKREVKYDLPYYQPRTVERQYIEIFWLPIALTASLINVSVESLAVVVMAHELAHAFTHRGADIDGERWDTRAFSEADSYIKEGLAQFYTASVCHRLYERFPAALDTYEKFLTLQSGAYLIHQTWAVKHKAQKEVVRAATIKCRKSQAKIYKHFKELIETEETALS